MNSVSFVDAVADRSGYPVGEVIDLLARVQVPTTEMVGVPHRLRVTRLFFEGTKAGRFTEPFRFNQQFGDGLWALTSEKNDRGKTSIIEIMMWALRGQPKRLQDDVRSWLRTIRLEGTVDDKRFVVEFEVIGGNPTGTLTCGNDVRPFASEAAFADTMSVFMTEQLDLQPFRQWVTNQGVSTHSWPLYSTVLYLPREASNAVIGDKAQAGLAQRLVQLFIGVRWVQTKIACDAALRQVQVRANQQHENNGAVQGAASSRIEDRTRELKRAKAKLAEFPSDLPTDEEIEEAKARWMELISQHGNVTNELQNAQREARFARHEVTQKRKQISDLTEAAIAKRLFHGLNPTTCPRCSTAIGSDRRVTERVEHLCAVCNRTLSFDHDDVIDIAETDHEDADESLDVNTLKQLIAEMEEAAALEQARVTSLTEQGNRLESRLEAARAQISTYSDKSVTVQERRALEAQIANLEAVIAELTELGGGSEEPTGLDSGVVAQLTILEGGTYRSRGPSC